MVEHTRKHMAMMLCAGFRFISTLIPACHDNLTSTMLDINRNRVSTPSSFSRVICMPPGRVSWCDVLHAAQPQAQHEHSMRFGNKDVVEGGDTTGLVFMPPSLATTRQNHHHGQRPLLPISRVDVDQEALPPSPPPREEANRTLRDEISPRSKSLRSHRSRPIAARQFPRRDKDLPARSPDDIRQEPHVILSPRLDSGLQASPAEDLSHSVSFQSFPTRLPPSGGSLSLEKSSATTLHDVAKAEDRRTSFCMSDENPCISTTGKPSFIPPDDVAPEGRFDLNVQLVGKASLRKVLENIQIPPPYLAHPKNKAKDTSKRTQCLLWFNTYRKLFTLALVINLVCLCVVAIGKWNYPRENTGIFILGNFLVAILVRNEFFTRFLYVVINALFAKWPPLWFRLACTSFLQHLGGIHTGCSISGFLWLLFCLLNKHKTSQPTVIAASGLLTALVMFVTMSTAIPWVRNMHHNVFERYHRFMGWAGLVLTWLFLLLGYSYNDTDQIWSLDPGVLIRRPDFWFALLITILIISPWLTIRKVKVHLEIPSPKTVIIRFARGMQQGLLARISRTPLLEYHAFGVVSEGAHSKYHYLVCGVQGDFTGDLVKNPPTHLWTRELKAAAVGNTCLLYKRGIRICTGTGIGAALSTCLQSPDWYLIWIGSDQEKTFGSTISNLIHKNIEPARMTLWDSKQRGGRPDIMRLIRDVYRSWKAEVVFVTSNWDGNKEVMEGCKAENIPVFGTLWDF